MHSKILGTVAAALLLSSAGSIPYAASAAPSPAQMKKAGEIKDPAAADAAVSKYEAKDAKKQAHRAHKRAKRAAHKAKVAEKKADKAAKEASSR